MNDIANTGAQKLIDMLQDPTMVKRFKGLSQKYLTSERMLSLCIEAVRKNPTLGECDPLTVLGAFVTSASLGLEPNTPLGQAHLIPYKGWYKDDKGKWQQKQAECNFQIGYRGFAQLFHRTGKVKDFCATAVRENDHFRHVLGTNTVIEYSKALKERGEIIGSFCHINKVNGGQEFELLTFDDIIKIRSMSETYKALERGLEVAKNSNDQNELKKAQLKFNDTPWVKWDDGMSAKCSIKRLSKTSDLDPEVAMAAEIDSLSDVGKADFKAILDARNTTEIFDVIAAQQKAALPAPSDTPMPTIDLEKDPMFSGKQPAAAPRQQAQQKPAAPAQRMQDGPPPGHPAHDLSNHF